MDAKRKMQEENEEFFIRVESLYNDFFSRINLENWISLLDCDAIWDLSNRAELSNRMLEFLTTHRFLPKHIWKFLDENFNWNEQENPFLAEYCDIIKYMKQQIKSGLSYDYFENEEGIDFETYLDYREMAYTSFYKRDINAAKLYINNAKAIYEKDYELLRLEGELYVRTGDYFSALETAEQLININPYEKNALLIKAQIDFQEGHYQQVIKSCADIQPDTIDNPEVILFIAKSYFKLGDYENAKVYFALYDNYRPFDSHIKKYIAIVNLNIRRKLLINILKQPKNKLLRHRFKEINVELKKQKKSFTEGEKVAVFSGHILLRSISIILLVSLLTATFLSLRVLNNSKEPLDKLDTVEVMSTDNVFELYPKINRIKIDILSAKILDLYCVWENGSESAPAILYSPRINKKNSFVYIGIHNGKAVIMACKKRIPIENPAALSFTGTIKKLSSVNFINVYLAIREKSFSFRPDTEFFIEIDDHNYRVYKDRPDVIIYILTFTLIFIAVIITLKALMDIGAVLHFKRSFTDK
ncbi:MAG: tetratricopeptide repeat protein [Bacillota bacterium]